MTLTQEGYRPRLVDRQLARILGVAGAVSLDGPKWCGKTWTALNHGESAFYVADPAGGFRNRELAHLDPTVALGGTRPHVIDEWQDAPGIWDAVRFEVDRPGTPGRFILTGSATPAEGTFAHSGAGRIVRVRMRPMTLTESGESSGRASLAAMANGEPVPVEGSELSLPALTNLILRGGWPSLAGLEAGAARDLTASYLEALANTDLARLDSVRRDPARALALLRSLARNTASPVSLATLRRDMAQVAGPSLGEAAIRDYLAALARLYVLEEIPAWQPALRSPARLRASPKRMLADPSLAAAALGADQAALTGDLKTLGLLFESLILRDLLVYAQVAGGSLGHYRDDADLEIDAIITLPDGRWLAVEVKVGYTQEDSAARNLLRLRRKLTAAGDPAPAAMIVVIGVGAFLHQRDDAVYVVPADRLGP